MCTVLGDGIKLPEGGYPDHGVELLREGSGGDLAEERVLGTLSARNGRAETFQMPSGGVNLGKLVHPERTCKITSVSRIHKTHPMHDAEGIALGELEGSVDPVPCSGGDGDPGTHVHSAHAIL